MATAVDKSHPTMPVSSGSAHRRRLSGWVLRAVVSVHLVAIFGQPVFAGLFLSGDYDGLRWHEFGANVTTSVSYVQLIAAIVVWVRLRQIWPFLATSALVAAETVQYFAGMEGALWLHLPLGVATVVALAVVFITVWLRPLRPRPRSPHERVQTMTESKQEGHEGDDDE
ncbi:MULTISPECIES: hypothetical protein [unclassified Streptomyces]|uniref:hypothetical protein n=1 Tax=unclassified Streptomyces TaxID=2593676 RepID=UPI00225C33B8|nr:MULTISPECIES: hypothetical protein [unclassified Streptomyces]MCX5106171.1 hypothetical protein [Streptomyces sp. NBC_00439]WSP46861.1 hypothetical protein OG348_13795 [Streptomyces sp. NBC_01243]